MWVIYEKTNRKIVGLSADCETDLDKQVALKEVVNGLINPQPVSKYDAIQVSDRSRAGALHESPRQWLVLREAEKGKLEVVIEEPGQSFLSLTCDAPDVHPVDGIPEIAADGESFTTITAKKTDAQGKALQGKEDNDQLYLRTDYGTLFSADGKKEISSITLTKGQASFRLVSQKARRVATVQVFNADAGLLDRTIRIEFI
jgi:hypothetical protein